jgi:tRNA(Ile)-lysidine synthase
VISPVLQTIAEHHMLKPGEAVGVAVSGGPDSVAMLHCLLELRHRLGIALGVVHVNHQLRGPESEQDQKFVADLCTRTGLPFVSTSVDVAGRAAIAGDNLEQTARGVRYEFFRRLIDEGRFDKIAVGHTLSDQAETVLYRLLRGSGSAGLAGIRPVLDGAIVRPLIGVSREQVLAYLNTGGFKWREDGTNRDLNRDRNRIRHELLPALTNEWNPNLTHLLGQLAHWAQDEEAYWEGIVPALAAEHLVENSDGIQIAAGSLSALPSAAARRLLRHAIKSVRGDLRGIGFGHVESILKLARSSAGSGQVHLPDLRVIRSFSELRLTTAASEVETRPPDYSFLVDPPGSLEGPWGTTLVTLKLYNRENLRGEQGYNRNCRGVLDWDKVPKPLRIRNWRPGDSYHPQGLVGPRKIKSLFQERRVAVWRREGWPVIVADKHVADNQTDSGRLEQIVWVREFGAAEAYAADQSSRVVLEVAEVERA